jgi:hypothetical protein
MPAFFQTAQIHAGIILVTDHQSDEIGIELFADLKVANVQDNMTGTRHVERWLQNQLVDLWHGYVLSFRLNKG